MNETDEVPALLREIRDQQKEQLAEYKKQADRSMLLAEESVARQKAIGSLYKKVVFTAAILIVAAVAYGLWASS